jgi:hypothetical protein
MTQIFMIFADFFLPHMKKSFCDQICGTVCFIPTGRFLYPDGTRMTLILYDFCGLAIEKLFFVRDPRHRRAILALKPCKNHI